MKSIFVAAMSLAGGVALGKTLAELPAAVAAAPCTALNGDVNGDGRIEIGDAIAILSHKFLGEPSQVVPLCSTTLDSPRLPDTGQAAWWTLVEGLGWSESPCDRSSCPGQDGAHGGRCASEGRFVDHGDGTVRDTCTGLVWQKASADVNEDGLSDEQDVPRWCDALAFCEGLQLADHDDWRLPNVRQLQSLVDYGRSDPALDPVFGARPSWYWSSTSLVDRSEDTAAEIGWTVTFDNGTVVSRHKDNSLFVRAVRGGL
jgi:hypothetical protein